MIIIALGANISSCYGSPKQTLYAAVDALARASGISVLAHSSIWRSAPVPVSDQPWYYNSVVSVAVDAMLDPHALLDNLNAIELEFGRVRGEKNAPRVLDLDLIDYNGRVMDAKVLCLPHPRMQARGFVLYPLQEIAPQWSHPVSGDGLAALIGQLPAAQEIHVIKEGEQHARV